MDNDASDNSTKRRERKMEKKKRKQHIKRWRACGSCCKCCIATIFNNLFLSVIFLLQFILIAMVVHGNNMLKNVMLLVQMNDEANNQYTHL